jgi:hypothetical protein
MHCTMRTAARARQDKEGFELKNRTIRWRAASLNFLHTLDTTACPQNLTLFLAAQHPPNATRILAPLLRLCLLALASALQEQHPCAKPAPDDHSASDDCAGEDGTEAPAGEGGCEEDEDAEEDAEMSAGGVRVVRESVEGRARRTCIQAYEEQECTRMERNCCADGDTPW